MLAICPVWSFLAYYGVRAVGFAARRLLRRGSGHPVRRAGLWNWACSPPGKDATAVCWRVGLSLARFGDKPENRTGNGNDAPNDAPDGYTGNNAECSSGRAVVERTRGTFSL